VLSNTTVLYYNISMPIFNKPKKVALYTRVSTEEQKTDLQLMDLKEYIQKRGYTIYNTYEDIISGATKERKALDQLMADAKHRKFDIVLVWKFDRFARSLKMLVDSLALFEELGIDFISYKENIDTTTSMGRLIFHINSAYAEFEREIIKDRVIAGIKAKREKTGTWGRKMLAHELRQKIKAMIAAKQSIRSVAKSLDISTKTVMKYKV
jgi:DNA invertase Pin-like site-specific DNA recombinase